MKTKDFIELLKKEDPTGEGYIRVEGGAIIGVDVKAGYWDGKYNWYDPKTRVLHISSQNYKVDVLTLDVDDIIWNEEGDMDKIRQRLKPDFDNYVNSDGQYKEFWNNVEKEALSAKKSIKAIKENANKIKKRR